MKHSNVTLLIFCGILLALSAATDAASVKREDEATGHLMLRHHEAKDNLEMTSSIGGDTKDTQANGDIRSLATTPLPIRLNSCGSAFVDDQGNEWEPDDAYANNGRKWKMTETILDTPNQDLYQTERWDKRGGKQLKYTFEVPNSWYSVRLHFSENYVNAKGERVFHIWVQGVREWENFDILSWAGGKFKPYVLEDRVWIMDESHVIKFQHVIENPKVNGIEILVYQLMICRLRKLVSNAQSTFSNRLSNR